MRLLMLLLIFGMAAPAYAAPEPDEDAEEQLQEAIKEELEAEAKSEPKKPAKKAVKKEAEEEAEEEEEEAPKKKPAPKKAEPKKEDAKKEDVKKEAKKEDSKKEEKKPAAKKTEEKKPETKKEDVKKAAPKLGAFECPTTLDVAEQKLAGKAPEGFAAFAEEPKYFLRGVYLYTGDKQITSAEPMRGTEMSNEWMLIENGKTHYHLVCAYSGTTLMLKKPLSESLNKCTLTLADNPANPHAPRLLLNMSCE